MKRRDFLKSMLGAVAVVAVPTLIGGKAVAKPDMASNPPIVSDKVEIIAAGIKPGDVIQISGTGMNDGLFKVGSLSNHAYTIEAV